MKRNILLIEPNYKNKYPPIGLMKISTYYKMLGDSVTFFKGDIKTLVIEDIYEKLLKDISDIEDSIIWEEHKEVLCRFILKGHHNIIEDILEIQENSLVLERLQYYRKYFKNQDYFLPENKKYDRINITTLFTFYWKISIETINFAKKLCKDEAGVKVGGVMASILYNEIKEVTGIEPFRGTISQAGVFDDNDIIIDSLPLDYSILDEIDYEYPAQNAYFAYTTRGCINKCNFCAVPKLEPFYQDYLPFIDQINKSAEQFGKKKDLLLLDNNILASSKFNKIIDEIKEAGFTKNAKFVEENIFELAIKNLKTSYNDKAYIRRIVKEFRKLLEKSKNKDVQDLYNL